MNWSKEKIAGDIGISARIFDADPAHFDPIAYATPPILPMNASNPLESQADLLRKFSFSVPKSVWRRARNQFVNRT